MARLRECYREYRRIGFNRLDAARFAWLVAMAGVRPIPIRAGHRR